MEMDNHMQILVHLHVNKTNFYMKGFALRLALKLRLKATRKSPIRLVQFAYLKLKVFIVSLSSDDGVLSHKEFVVVMKNQLVRGLENVSFCQHVGNEPFHSQE